MQSPPCKASDTIPFVILAHDVSWKSTKKIISNSGAFMNRLKKFKQLTRSKFEVMTKKTSVKNAKNPRSLRSQKIELQRHKQKLGEVTQLS